MRRFIESLFVLAALACVAGQTAAQTPPPSSQGSTSDTVRVAPPTGEMESDRARILAALESVRPGGTVLFSSGTYMLGEGVRVTVPNVTLMGHPEGTVLRGCDPERFDLPEGFGMDAVGAVALGCTGLWVLADRQTIRGLTFDHTWHGLLIGHPLWELEPGERPEPGFGGHRIENNVFRNVPNGIRIVGPTDEVTVIRDNEVVNAYHGFQSTGARVRIEDNRFTVPEPGTVPAANYPESAVILSPAPGWDSCHGSHVVGNVVEGTVHGIQVLAGGWGTCENLEIRDNHIRIRPVPLPTEYPIHLRQWYFGEDAEGSAVSGTAIRLYGTALGDAPDTATITDVLIENNRILGGAGLGIELTGASGNRIVGNSIQGVRPRSPFPGLTWGDNPERWREANGSGIWVSPGSDENEILGNTFDDIPEAAVFVVGDRNVVISRSPEDEVRDLGNGNRVTVRTGGLEEAIRAYLDDFAAQDPEAWREHITHDFLLIENGYPLEPERFTEAWDPATPWGQTYRLHDLRIDVHGRVAVYGFELGWYKGDERVSWGVETGHARLVEGEWRLARNHMTWLPPRGTASRDDLRDYVGEYVGPDFQGGEYRLILFVEDDELYMRRPGGEPVAASVGRVRLIPGPAEDQFFAEFVNGEMRFRRDREGRVTGYLYLFPLEVLPGQPDRVEAVKVR